MSPLRTIWLVARRDFKERLLSRAFQISSAFTILLVLGIVIVPTFFVDDSAPTTTIGTVGETAPTLEAQVAAAFDDDRTVTTVAYPDAEAASKALEMGDVDVVVVSGAEVIVVDEGSTLGTIVATAAATSDFIDAAAEFGLTAGDLTSLLESATYEVNPLEPAEEEDESSRAFAFIATILLFISIVTYGQWILIGVIEEKTNRVVEVVLGAVPARHLLAGKILGIGALGLGQLALTAIAGLWAVIATDAFDLPDTVPSVTANVFVWFILGFAFYATAYAAAGALVSRQEEAQNVAFPLTITMTLAYFVAAFSVNGENPVLQITSLLPPFAPMTMPLRMASGDAVLWEVALSFGLMVVSTYYLIVFAARVYSGGLLRAGGRVRVKDAWRSAEG